MPSVDIDDEILADDASLIFAADQTPFEVQKTGAINYFCLLVPLMHLDGRAFGDPLRVFPTRGRVWWMLRQDLSREAVAPGSLWTAQVEPAIKRDKDHYQARRFSLVPGARGWVEVLAYDGADPDVGRICGREGLPWPRPPLTQVMFRGRKSVLGPFRSAWDPATRRLRCTALNLGRPVVWRAPAELIPAGALKTFRFTANQWDQAEEQELTVGLVAEDVLKQLEARGVTEDAASEEQLIKWALGLADFSNSDRSEFRRALDALPSAADARAVEFPGRLDRFRALCEQGERVLGLGREVARAMAEQPAFEGLMAQHVEAIAAQRIEQAVAERQAELERRTQDAQRRSVEVAAEAAAAAAEFERQRQELRDRLAREEVEQRRLLEQKSSELRVTEARVAAVLDAYQARAAEIGDQLLVDVPILQRLWSRGEGSPSQSAVSGPLLLGDWLDRPIAAAPLSEIGFLDQLRERVARRGFVFDSDDLINLHVAVKTGLWTVVAGPTGLGKSALPRLYAEGLGMLDHEYLTLAVQPDWLDDRDVLGAFNALSGRFEPAATGLVDLLIHAAEDARRGRGGIYLVCLDEMNLSRVEHYFARFLSVLEQPAARRTLTLFSEGQANPGDPYLPWRQLPLGDNVRFVGTVNIDETTHFFSPKVLDRAALLTLEPPALDRPPTHEVALSPVTPVALKTYRSWIRGAADADPGTLPRVLAIDAVLRRIRSGLGFRLRDRILAYTASARGLLSADRAFDLAVAQTVLPRIATHHPDVARALAELSEQLPEARYPRCGRLLRTLREAEGRHDFFQLL